MFQIKPLHRTNARIGIPGMEIAPLVLDQEVSTTQFWNAVQMLAQSVVRRQNLHLKLKCKRFLSLCRTQLELSSFPHRIYFQIMFYRHCYLFVVTIS